MILIDKQGHPARLHTFSPAKVWIAECDMCFKQEAAVCSRFSTLKKRLVAEGWYVGEKGAIVCSVCLASMDAREAI
jgi:hypothetical protein